MKIGIGIFAKTIGHSRVKTRLAEGIGQRMAEEFYGLCVTAIDEVVTKHCNSSNNEIDIYWARPSGSYDICTKGLGLGAAMHKVATQILKECDAYILIGTDTPQISQRTIDSVINIIINNHDKIVLGPSCDGGFYLLAGTMVPLIEIMESVQYSKSDTLNQLLSLLREDNFAYSLIEELSDVDIVEDLKLLRKYLEDRLVLKEILLESQHSILNWLIKRNLG